MSVFESPEFDGHETVAFFDLKPSGRKAIIAIHSTALGPACGGTRMRAYASTSDALTDVLRLSKGMSYKNAIAGLPLGGGKAVIIGDPGKDKSAALFAAYGAAINALGGRYVTAMDVGMVPSDMPIIARHTRHIAGYDQPGRSGGDSGPLTALGVFVGLKAAVGHRLGQSSTKGMTAAIQGLGKVGMSLAERLHQEGARLIVADVSADRVRVAADRFGAAGVAADAIVLERCDVFAPCALGGILDERTIPLLKASVVAGGANNQLARSENGELLKSRGILYAPDYVINAGGIIRVAGQIYGWSDGEIEERTLRIGPTLSEIFRRADARGEATSAVADAMAVERLRLGAASARAAE
ncbi:MAG: amino acid dehydrogenase [Alphaproteobacteria bacterium]|nr:amino acid dehydrogenase [Alphaproteobacteria bacterium]